MHLWFNFWSSKRAFLGFYRANGAGKSHHQNADLDFFGSPHLAFVGLTATCRIIAKIMSRILESFSTTHPAMVDRSLSKRPTRFWKRSMMYRLAAHDFEWSFDLKELSRILCGLFTRSTDAGGYCGFLASQSQSSLFKEPICLTFVSVKDKYSSGHYPD